MTGRGAVQTRDGSQGFKGRGLADPLVGVWGVLIRGFRGRGWGGGLGLDLSMTPWMEGVCIVLGGLLSGACSEGTGGA